MDELQPGHCWKIPFCWEPGCPPPPVQKRLSFETAPEHLLRSAIGAVMSSSLDESDRFTVSSIGLAAAVQQLYELLPQDFEHKTSQRLVQRKKTDVLPMPRLAIELDRWTVCNDVIDGKTM